MNRHQSVPKKEKFGENSEIALKNTRHTQSEHCSQGVGSINVDDLLEQHVGACGLWQWMVVILCVLSAPSMSVFPVFANAVPDLRCQMEPFVEQTFSNYSLNFKEIANIIMPNQVRSDGTQHGCTRLQINWTNKTILNQMITDSLQPNRSQFRNFTDVSTEACPFGYVYQSQPFQYTSTIVAEFNLVCNQSWIPSFGVFLFMIGTLVGYILGGWFGDKYGRKPTAIGFSMAELVGAVIISTAPNQYIYHAGRTFVGITFTGKASVLRLLPIELTLAKYRGYFSSFTILGIAFFHQTIMVCVAYLIPQWRWLNAICMMPGLLCFTFFFLLPESPRWYNSKKRPVKAIKVLQRGMCINHKCSKSQPNTERLQILLTEYNNLQSEENPANFTASNTSVTRQKGNKCNYLISILPSGALLKNLVVGMSLHFVQILAHFGLLLYARVIHKSIYFVALMNATAAIPGPVIASVLYRVFRYRRVPLIVCYLIIVCTLLIGSLYSIIMRTDDDTVLNVCCNCALIMYSATFVMLSIYVAELFPSTFRTRAIGLSAGVGRLGGSLSTFVNQLGAHVIHGLPILVYAGSALLQLLLLFFIPDTTGENLPDTEINEVDRIREEYDQDVVAKCESLVEVTRV
ncbi:Solute carrier family 22 member 1 [Fasciola hepatica]|uniref:Solute carrier family 22 member 1 n=1 Tax=Fasciola hepatica TaxID=6192 RepID=A0A4E0RHC9_FASHE|nr:Solute carrier family 22 member 1 [Fasciola hepatica]